MFYDTSFNYLYFRNHAANCIEIFTFYANHMVIKVALPYLTLPYHTGKTFYRLALRPLTGPMRIPE